MIRFVTNRKRKLFRIALRSASAAFWRTPIFAHIAPTRECNLACEYCYQNDPISDTMSWKRFIDTLDSCEKLGIRIISFTGGEPMLWEHLQRGIHECAKRGLLVGLTTNGVCLTERFLLDVGADLDHINLSMDSIYPTRQSQKVLSLRPELPRMLQVASMRTGLATTSNMVLSKANEGQLELLVERMNSSGIPVSIGFVNAPPSCETESAFPHEIAYSAPQDIPLLRRIVKRVSELKAAGRYIVEPVAYFANYERHLRNERTWNCSSSKGHSLQIGPDGSIMSCTRLSLHGDMSIHGGRRRIRGIVREIAGSSKECQTRCYSNCSYNNGYYRKIANTPEFISNVLRPAVG